MKINNLYKGHALANPGSSIESEYNYIGRPLKLNWHTLNPIKNVHILKVPPVKTRIYDGGRFWREELITSNSEFFLWPRSA